MNSQLVLDAMCMRLSAALEVLHRLDEPTRERLFGGNWRLMWGMRNRIAHGYLLMDPAIILRTVAIDVPGIVTAILFEDSQPVEYGEPLVVVE